MQESNALLSAQGIVKNQIGEKTIEIYKPGKTDFPALIPQNGAMAELLLSRLSEEVEVQYAVPIN